MGEAWKFQTFTGNSTHLCKFAIVTVLMRQWLCSARCQESIHTAACFYEISTKESERKVSNKVLIFTSGFFSFAENNSVLRNVAILSEKMFPCTSLLHILLLCSVMGWQTQPQDLLGFPCHLVCACSLFYSSCLIIQIILWPFENGNKVKIKKVKICIHKNITCTSGNGVARAPQRQLKSSQGNVAAAPCVK